MSGFDIQVQNDRALVLREAMQFVHVFGASGSEVRTTSLKIADMFTKMHKDVLKAIRNLPCSDDFRRRNFAPTDFIDKNGDSQPAFEITKDGFMLLAMGFTGAAATAWKETFIKYFNAMADELVALSMSRALAGQLSVYERERLGAWQRNGLIRDEWDQIRDAISEIAEYGEGEREQDMIYNAVHAHMIRYFGASNGGVLPFRGAMMYLREIRARYAAGYRPTYVAGRLVYDLTMS